MKQNSQKETLPQPAVALEKSTVDLSIIIPIYNEEGNIEILYKRLREVLNPLGKVFEIIFINDGSTDASEVHLTKLYHENPETIRVIHFSRNFGHQLALTAGLNHSQGDAAVILDADLQDPPELITQFVKEWEQGFEIVYGLRTEREGETFFKTYTASLFYKLIRATTAIDIPENVGDFYLLDRKVINILNALKERHRFIRGLVAWSGFRRKAVEYVRKSRHAGKTKYSLWKMVKFSFDAMTSFSFAPLRFVSVLGAIFSLISFMAILLIIYLKLFTDATIVGWSSMMAVILFIGGIQLLSLGIIGEYVARIGDDVKSRPLYTIKQFLN
ncbi:MAG: glycosyltransferase family 2 protein [Candidatus Omnitrophica bacterium]|nr:glycosyltransferase family 2 protein [Candidatus Omnitrophota bacterium]